MLLAALAGYAIGKSSRKKRIRELEAELEDLYYYVDFYIEEDR